MRIDSQTFFASSLAAMQDNQASIARLNQQIASGNKLLAPKDDPLATQKIIDLTSRIALRTQYAANQDQADFSLNYENTVVDGLGTTLQQARALLVGISGSSDPSLLTTNADQLKTLVNQLLGMANTRDASGNYIFGGFATTTQPFDNAGGGAATTYVGTPQPGGTRNVAIADGRQVQVNDNLDTVFQSGVAGSDLLQQLGQAATDLAGGTITQADINAYVAVIDSAQGKLDHIQYRIAGAQTEIADVRATSNALMLQEKNALGDLQQVDQAAAIVELQTRLTTLQAAQQSYAKTANLSLFNYLS